ncbi:MAG: hypothetical protein OXE99_00665 [Cellvibrionales bacterium]|nr:hypothetical protein [Cellvibrionales bacterium]
MKLISVFLVCFSCLVFSGIDGSLVNDNHDELMEKLTQEVASRDNPQTRKNIKEWMADLNRSGALINNFGLEGFSKVETILANSKKKEREEQGVAANGYTFSARFSDLNNKNHNENKVNFYIFLENSGKGIADFEAFFKNPQTRGDESTLYIGEPSKLTFHMPNLRWFKLFMASLFIKHQELDSEKKKTFFHPDQVIPVAHEDEWKELAKKLGHHPLVQLPYARNISVDRETVLATKDVFRNVVPLQKIVDAADGTGADN